MDGVLSCQRRSLMSRPGAELERNPGFCHIRRAQGSRRQQRGLAVGIRAPKKRRVNGRSVALLHAARRRCGHPGGDGGGGTAARRRSIACPRPRSVVPPSPATESGVGVPCRKGCRSIGGAGAGGRPGART